LSLRGRKKETFRRSHATPRRVSLGEMAKNLCTSCERKLPGPVAFCPACDQPTVHATDAERLEWDLRRWRAHVDRAVASGLPMGSVALAEAPAPVFERAALDEGAPALERAPAPERAPADPKSEFSYRACVTCERTDWIVRTTRNEDGTWNHWCVRCSRSFKTDVRLHQALKPFVSAGAVVGGIVAASLLLLH